MERYRTTTTLTPIELCEVALFREALTAIENDPPGPEKKLIQGAVLAGLDRPEEAKDLLSAAADGLQGDLKDKARIWLACCYWATGEKSEARIVLQTLRPASDTAIVACALIRSIVESDDLRRSMLLITEAEQRVESVNPLLRGKVLNQKGWLYRRLKKPDHAIIAYEEARYWFEQVEDPRFFAGTTNNLAGLLSDFGRFDEAHRAVDKAIASHKRSGANKFLADAYDQKAQIFLAEKRYIRAGNVAPKAVEILEDSDQKEALARALVTQALTLSQLGENVEALRRLDRALSLGRVLSNHDLLLDIERSRIEVGTNIIQQSDANRIVIALTQCDGSYRAAADKLNTTHPRLSRLIKKYKLRWNGKKPLRSILKPSK